MTGTIRVSVVATGTDATMVQALEPMKANPSRVPLQATVMRQAAAERQPVAQAAPEPEPELEQHMQEAVAEAISHSEPSYNDYPEDDGITVEPYIPHATHTQLEEAPRLIDAPIPSAYVPSSAERPDGQRRMPRTEEFPAVARQSLTAQEKHEAEPRNARALFKRLASNVGLNLKSNEPQRSEPAVEVSADDAAARSAIEAGGARNPRASNGAEGARGNADQYGRTQPQPAQKEHIEIPAFLRKHG
jgi:cell division protein FtsZ